MLMSAVFISRELIPRDFKTGKSPVTTLNIVFGAANSVCLAQDGTNCKQPM